MIAVLTFLIILIISVLVTKIATVALTHTGLSRESARFQARSAFTGVGFTTTEAERVVSHPVRRRILMILMLLGNAGIVTAISSLILTFVNAQAGEGNLYFRMGIIILGIALLWTLAASPVVDRWLSYFIGRALKRWTDLDTRDYASLLHLSGEYQVKEIRIEPDDWVANRCLQELSLTREGILVLGIKRYQGPFIGAPTKETRIAPGDVVIFYGRDKILQNLDMRRSGYEGDRDHRKAVHEQEKVLEKQETEETDSGENKEEISGPDTR